MKRLRLRIRVKHRVLDRQESRRNLQYWSSVVFRIFYGRLDKDQFVNRESNIIYIKNTPGCPRRNCESSSMSSTLWDVFRLVKLASEVPTHSKLALCNIRTTFVIIFNFASGTFNQALNALIIIPLISFPGFDAVYSYGSKTALEWSVGIHCTGAAVLWCSRIHLLWTRMRIARDALGCCRS